QRVGKSHRTLPPGLNFVIPFLDDIAYKVTTTDIVLDIPGQEVITEDNAVIIANAVAYINIISPEKAVYGVDNYIVAIRTLVQTALRDRKSTRLNSSQVKDSYAVFCLKT